MNRSTIWDLFWDTIGDLRHRLPDNTIRLTDQAYNRKFFNFELENGIGTTATLKFSPFEGSDVLGNLPTYMVDRDKLLEGEKDDRKEISDEYFVTNKTIERPLNTDDTLTLIVPPVAPHSNSNFPSDQIDSSYSGGFIGQVELPVEWHGIEDGENHHLEMRMEPYPFVYENALLSIFSSTKILNDPEDKQGKIDDVDEASQRVAQACDDLVQAMEDAKGDVWAAQFSQAWDLSLGLFDSPLPGPADLVGLPFAYAFSVGASTTVTLEEKEDGFATRLRPGWERETYLDDARNQLPENVEQALYGPKSFLQKDDFEEVIEGWSGPGFFSDVIDHLNPDTHGFDGFEQYAYEEDDGDITGLEKVIRKVGEVGIPGQIQRVLTSSTQNLSASEEEQWAWSLWHRMLANSLIAEHFALKAVTAQNLVGAIEDEHNNVLETLKAELDSHVSGLKYGLVPFLLGGPIAGTPAYLYGQFKYHQEAIDDNLEEFSEAEQAFFVASGFLYDAPSVIRRIHLNSGVGHLISNDVGPHLPKGTVEFLGIPEDERDFRGGELAYSGRVEIFDDSDFKYAGSAVEVTNEGSESSLFFAYFRYEGRGSGETDTEMSSIASARLDPGETKILFAVHNHGFEAEVGRPVDGAAVEVDVLEVNDQGIFWIDSAEREWTPAENDISIDPPPKLEKPNPVDFLNPDGTFPQTAIALAAVGEENIAEFPNLETEQAARMHLNVANPTRPVLIPDVHGDDGLEVVDEETGRVTVQHLDLGYAGLSDLSLFDGTTFGSLKRLGLEYNAIENLSGLGGASFSNSHEDPSLTHLDLHGNNIEDLSPLSSSAFSSLKRLNLQRNDIQAFAPLVEEPFSEDLERLDLGTNEITSLSAFDGSTFHDLERLSLQNNEIDDLAGLAGANLPSLERLDLSHNNLQNLSDFEGETFPNLTHLYLSHNEIDDLSGLEAFPDLQVLYLADNSIDDLSSLAEVELPRLRELSLRKNEIEDIEPLLELDSLSTLPTQPSPLNSNGVYLPDANVLQYLNVSNNPLNDRAAGVIDTLQTEYDVAVVSGKTDALVGEVNALNSDGFISSNVEATKAYLVGTVQRNDLKHEALEVVIEYQNRDGRTITRTVEATDDKEHQPSLFGREVTGLDPETDYKFRLRVEWGDETKYSEWQPFTTKTEDRDDTQGIREVNALGPSAQFGATIEATEAYLAGQMILNGLTYDDVDVTFVYKTSEGQTREVYATDRLDYGAGRHLVGVRIGDSENTLEPGTTYEYRVRVEWNGETESSDWVSFTTESEDSDDDRGIEKVEAQGFGDGPHMSKTGTTEAFLAGTVDLDGLDLEDVTVRFEYLMDGEDREGANTAAITTPPGKSPLVGADVTGLDPDTDYEFRIRVEWKDDVEFSGWVSFTTAEPSEEPPPGGDLAITIEGPETMIVGYENAFRAKVNTDDSEIDDYHWSHDRYDKNLDLYRENQKIALFKPTEDLVGSDVEIYATVRNEAGTEKVTESREVEVVPQSEANVVIDGPSKIEPGEWAELEIIKPSFFGFGAFPIWNASHEKSDAGLSTVWDNDTHEEARHFAVRAKKPGDIAVQLDFPNTDLVVTKTVTVTAPAPPSNLDLTGRRDLATDQATTYRVEATAATEADVEWAVAAEDGSAAPAVDVEVVDTETRESDQPDRVVTVSTVEVVAGKPGTYTLSAEVADAYGQTDRVSLSITAADVDPPEIQEIEGPAALVENQATEYRASATGASDLAFAWTLSPNSAAGDGDGESGEATTQADPDRSDQETQRETFEVAPDEPGEYTLTVTVTDKYGQTGSETKSIEVFAPLEVTMPAAEDPEAEPVPEGEPIEVTATATGGTGREFTWSISFESEDVYPAELVDETTTRPSAPNENQPVEDTYRLDSPKPGTYYVEVEVTDDLGQSAATTALFDVHELLGVAIDGPDEVYAEEDYSREFTMTVEGDVTFVEWTILHEPQDADGPPTVVDQQENDSPDTTDTYELDSPKLGRYVIRVRVRNERGETDEAEITVSAVEPSTLLAFLKRVLHAINDVLTSFSD